MNTAYQIKRTTTLNPVWFTVLRVILGACLAFRGVYFFNHIPLLNEVITGSTLNALNFTTILVMFIIWAHLLGGTFIILGLITRISVWVQIPIVLGAIMFINTRGGFFSKPSDLVFSIFILALLAFFAFEGGGKISMDDYAKKHLL